MKRMRIPLFVALGVALLGFILGTFLDQNISSSIASKTNMFAITISAISPTLGFGGLALLAGGLFAITRKGGFKTWVKVVFYVMVVAVYGVCVYYAGKEYFGVNGFNNGKLNWVGYLIAAIVLAGAIALGYYLFKDNTNKRMWAVIIVGFIVAILALVAGVSLLKIIFHRPRWRAIVDFGIEYHAWYQPCSNYKDLMAAFSLTSEEFKSFPSGHTCEASMLLIPITFIGLANEKAKKFQIPAFTIAFVFVMFVGFCRILAAAHFLSDISMGTLLTTLFLIIANEIVLRVKFFKGDVSENA